MTIAFRADASLQIGTGHVMRCLALADALRKRAAQCSFICRPHTGHLLDLITQRGHRALALPAPQEGASGNRSGTAHADWLGTDWASDADETQQVLASIGGAPLDWLVVDHYALDQHWERALRPNARHIMVIDDLADRAHDCDLLLDQNLGRTERDYAGLLGPDATTLIGPQYALLRPGFAELRPQSLARRAQHPQLKHLLITMGGVDKTNVTGQVLDALQCCTLPPDLRITVVMGPHAPWLAQVQAKSTHMPWPTKVLVGVSNMAQLMAESDLCIGAVGSTSWERCCLGLPTIQLVLAANQKEAAMALAQMGVALSINASERLADDLRDLMARVDSQLMGTLTEQSAAICNGRGSSDVIRHLLKF